MEICSGNGRYILGKGENFGYQHFLLFPDCFFFLRVVKSRDCVCSDEEDIDLVNMYLLIFSVFNTVDHL